MDIENKLTVAAAGVEQFLRLYLLRAVGVHHHGQRTGIGQQQSLLRVDESILILGQLFQSLNQFLCRCHTGTFDNVNRNSVFPAQRINACRRTHGIVIRCLVTHNKYLRGV